MDLRRHADLKEDVPLTAAAGDGDKPKGKAPGRLWISLTMLAAVGLVIAIYSNTLHAPFMFDDLTNITDNDQIRIEKLSLKGLIDAGFKSYASNRPLANISFAINYYLHGYDLPGYHIFNILVHILTGLALFSLVRLTILVSRERSVNPGMLEGVDPSQAAFFAMLIWLVHPLCTQSVTYLVQRMTSMAAMFYVLSMLCYVKGRLSTGRIKWLLFSGCFVSGVSAVASKEISSTLPFFIFLYEWYFFQDLNTGWVKRKAQWGAVIIAAFVLLAVAFLGTDLLRAIKLPYANREFTMAERVLTEFRVVIFYLSQMVLPHPSRLNLTHEYPLSHSLLDPVTTVLSLAAIIALLALSIVSARRERLLSFAIIWYFGNLAIESTVIGLEIVFEHRTYLPSMFLIAVFVAAVFRHAKPRWTGIVALCIVAGVFSTWTYQRNATWGDRVVFLRDALKKDDSMRNHSNLGIELMYMGYVDEALVHFRRAIELRPNSAGTNRNLAEALMRKKKYEEAYEYYKKTLILARDDRYRWDSHIGMGSALDGLGRHAEAVKEYRLALAVVPRSEKALNLMGRKFAEQGMFTEALDQFRAALAINPRSGEACNYIANVMAQQGRVEDALKYYREAVRVSPGFADPRYNMANLLIAHGRERDAIAMYNEAVKANPRYASAHLSLAALFYERGELEKSVRHFQEVVRLDPADQEAKKNLATVSRRLADIRAARAKVLKALDAEPGDPGLMFQMAELNRMEGNFDEAIGYYRKVLEIQPGLIKALRQLAVSYTLSGDLEKAMATLKTIIGLNPGDPEAYYNTACLYSRQGNADECRHWLVRAVEKGFRDWDLMDKDRDLAGIRGTEFYRSLKKGK